LAAGPRRSKDRGPRAKELRKKGKAGDAGPTIRGPRITLHRSGHAAARPRGPCLTLGDRQVDDRQVDDRQVDDRQVDDRQVDDRQVDDRQVDDRQVDDRQVDDRQVDDRPAHKKSPAAGLGRIWAGSKGAINNLHNTYLHTHLTLHELPHNLGRNWGTRSNHRRHLLNHKNKERFYKNTRDERRVLFCFYT
jgi:hypothetical protein